ncbi:MAG: thioredoxin family protein, partial [Burkholderiaceae bacterium]
AAAEAKGRALFVKVDSDASPATAARFAVRSIPTVVRLNRGTEVERFSGVRGSADLVRFALG